MNQVIVKRLTPGGETLLEWLSRIVSMATDAQIAETLGLLSSGCGGLRRLLSHLREGGWIRRIEGYARWPGARLKRCFFSPGEEIPNVDRIAYQSRKRWRLCPPRRVTVWSATAAGARYCGSPVARIKRAQIGHSLAVTTIANMYRKDEPEAFKLWQGEALMAHTRSGHGELLPDAFLCDGKREIGVIEICAGNYSASRLRDLFEDCRSRELALDLFY